LSWDRKIIVPVFLALALAIFVVAYLQKRSLENALLQESFLRTYEAVLQQTPRYIDVTSFAEPFSGPAQKRFQALFREIQNSTTIRMSLWSDDRRILFSNLKSIIAVHSPRHADLATLFANPKPFFIRRTEDPNWPTQTAVGEFLDMYIPISVAGKVVAGMEIHSAVSGILSPVKTQSYYNGVLLTASGAAILIICFLAKNLKDDRDRQNALANLNSQLYQESHKHAQALQKSNAELEQFAYVASHDLQEPLRMITGYTTLLARRYQGKLDKEADEFIGYAVDGAKRMQGLIQDLLSYSRVGSKGKEFARVDCEVVVAQTLTALQVAIQESGASVTREPLPTVLGDETQLVQLFQNLVGNAIKYRNSKAPEVHISCAQKAGEWVFAVKDNGIGIDPRYAQRIFVIFQRLHTREEYVGTGIGLAICKKIVERHGGKIWMESELGKGATFYFTMPAFPIGAAVASRG
jgi:signal transduction histidine kinase